MQIAEIFGYGLDNLTDEAWDSRRAKRCPFRDSPCTKSSKKDPLGVCSLSDGVEAAALCPVRFTERDVIFTDAARLAFGEHVTFGIFPEVRILKVTAGGGRSRARKIGKVDYLLGKIQNGVVVDFAAVEVQAVYFSGGEIRSLLNHYIENQELDLASSERRADFRSSAQKRLIPQLQLKVPVFRRWGKKVFVVVDTKFFQELPRFSTTTPSNSELTWLAYPIIKTGVDYKFGEVKIVYSEWDDVRNALREGTPPEPDEIVAELQTRLDRRKNPARVLES